MASLAVRRWVDSTTSSVTGIKLYSTDTLPKTDNFSSYPIIGVSVHNYDWPAMVGKLLEVEINGNPVNLVIPDVGVLDPLQASLSLNATSIKYVAVGGEVSECEDDSDCQEGEKCVDGLS